jgi:hypothetical protein
MAIALVQAKRGFKDAFFDTCSATLDSTTTAGNTIIVFAFAGAQGAGPPSFSGDGVNSYTTIQAYTASYATYIGCWLVTNIAGGSVTVSIGTNITGNNMIHVSEWSGVDNSTPTSATQSNNNNIGAGGYSFNPTSSSMSANDGQVIVSAAGASGSTSHSGTLGVGTNFTQASYSSFSDLADAISICEYRAITSNGSYTVTTSQSGGVTANDWQMETLVLNAAAVAPTNVAFIPSSLWLVN